MILKTVDAIAVQAKAIGPVALQALASGISGRVEVVFARSFYVRFGEWWICVGRGLGLGPLNVSFDVRTGTSLSELIHPGDVTAGSTLAFRKLVVQTARAEHWSPPRRGRRESKLLQRGLAVLDAVLPPIPGEGLASLIRPDQKAKSLVRAALPPARYLSALVLGGTTRPAIDPERIAPLIGLGPGLTPSGDDYLGGALVALHMTGHGRMARQIWRAIAPLASVRTNDISIAHMSAAAEGYGSASQPEVCPVAISASRPSLVAALSPSIRPSINACRAALP